MDTRRVSDRRRFLLGLAAASTAAATASVGSASTLAENAELIRLGNQLPAFEAAYVQARKCQDEVADKWSPLWPEAPEELTSSDYNGEKECDFFGASKDRKIYTCALLRDWIDQAQRAIEGPRKKRGWRSSWGRDDWEAELKHLQRLNNIAATYESETARIEKAADYKSMWEATGAATKSLAAHVSLIMNEADQSMAGLLIKAEALAAWGRVKPSDHWWHPFDQQTWNAQIANSILRHAQGGVA